MKFDKTDKNLCGKRFKPKKISLPKHLKISKEKLAKMANKDKF